MNDKSGFLIPVKVTGIPASASGFGFFGTYSGFPNHSDAVFVAPMDMRIKNFRMMLSAAIGAGQTITFQVYRFSRIAGASFSESPTPLVITISAVADGADLVDEVVLNAGEAISMTVGSSGGATAVDAFGSLEGIEI